jgi:hypothetical protein
VQQNRPSLHHFDPASPCSALGQTRQNDAVQMIDTSIARVHRHGACAARSGRQSMGRSRGGSTSKIHAVVDTNGPPVRVTLTAGEAHVSTHLAEGPFGRYAAESRPISLKVSFFVHDPKRSCEESRQLIHLKPCQQSMRRS